MVVDRMGGERSEQWAARHDQELSLANVAVENSLQKLIKLQEEYIGLQSSFVRRVCGSLSGRSIEKVKAEYDAEGLKCRNLARIFISVKRKVEGYRPTRGFAEVKVAKNGEWSFTRSDGSTRKLTAEEKEGVYSSAKHQLLKHHENDEFFNTFGPKNIFLREGGDGKIEVALGGFKKERFINRDNTYSREDLVLRDKQRFCFSYRKETIAGIGDKMPGRKLFLAEKSGPEFNLMHFAEWEREQLEESISVEELPKINGYPSKEGYTFVRAHPTEIREEGRFRNNVIGYTYSKEGCFVKNENISKYKKLGAIIAIYGNRWNYTPWSQAMDASPYSAVSPLTREGFIKRENENLDALMKLI